MRWRGACPGGIGLAQGSARGGARGANRSGEMGREVRLQPRPDPLPDRRDDRRSQATFTEQLVDGGATAARARAEVADSIDRMVWYAGWADKFAQIYGNLNPVAGPFFNISAPEPTGVVGVIAPESPALLGLVSRLAPVIVTGNTAVVIASETQPMPCHHFCGGLGKLGRPARCRQHLHRLGRRIRALAGRSHGCQCHRSRRRES